MNQSSLFAGTDLSEQQYSPEEHLLAAIHSHFHTKDSNQSDCNNITNFIRDYLLFVAKNISISSHTMLNTSDTKPISIESKS